MANETKTSCQVELEGAGGCGLAMAASIVDLAQAQVGSSSHAHV